ncbi:hypothetical protein D1872_294180 [compost metagenome]
MNHRVRFGQVQANATGLQADQKYLTLAALEFLHRSAAVAGLAGQQGVGDSTLVQLILNQRQH